MRFELDSVLMDQILFYMENQDGDFILDTREGTVIDIMNDNHDNKSTNKCDYNDNDRFINIPKWRSNDGFRLMEKFASCVKNPVIRHELGEALNKNKGVFRAFRDVLEQYPESEKMWFNYKEKAMKDTVLLWYNALREQWGLLPIGPEPEDTTSLVLEDFVIREQESCVTEHEGKNSIVFTAENEEGEIAGSIRGSVKDSRIHINEMEVKDEYQCLGLGKTLLSKFLQKADKLKFDVVIDLPVETEYFSRSLFLENFKLTVQRFTRKAQE
ncbi:MAG: UPF0158 family protein [Treponema sp.]|nr:UPF0158 family protein [Treponema sp.]MCL2237871.1 UPF0158 family protein [Treponema sp.]